jgi:predicted protein tyrosine phosphatase
MLEAMLWLFVSVVLPVGLAAHMAKPEVSPSAKTEASPLPPAHDVTLVAPGLYLGAYECAEDPAWLKANVGAVVNAAIANDVGNTMSDELPYHTVYAIDADWPEETEAMGKALDGAVAFIDSHADRNVLVHCVEGKSRSPTMVLAWMVSHGASLRAALAQLRGLRPVVRPNNGFMRVLIDYEERVTGRSTLDREDYPAPILMGQ